MRLDKYLKVSRLVKRRTLAKEVADKGRIEINGKVAKSSSTVKVGDELTLYYGNKILKVRVTDIKDSTKKQDAAYMYEIISAYNKWLSESDIPKLCLYAHPGAIIMGKEVDYIKERFPNTKMVDIGEGIHYVQEDNPHLIGEELAKWYREL